MELLHLNKQIGEIKVLGPGGIRTRIARSRARAPNHYTIAACKRYAHIYDVLALRIPRLHVVDYNAQITIEIGSTLV